MQSGGPPATTAPPGSGTTTVSTVTSVPPKPVIPGSSTLRTTPHTSYHVPRGAAAVANIAVPRSGSLATPIVRTGGLVSIRNSARAPSPAPQQSRTRPASTATLPGTRPATPQRTDTSHPSQLHAPEKPVLKGAVSLSQVTGRPATLSSTAPRLSTTQPPSIQSTVQLVTQATTQPVTLPTSQPATLQLVTQPVAPLASQPNSQPGPQPTIVTSNSALNARPRPISQATQAGTPTSLAASTPAVVLATPARLTSPGLLGVTTGPARLAVATALPATNARLVGPPARLQQGRTVTYTSSHQVLQAARLPPAPVRLGPAGRGVVSLHMGVAPLKPSPTNLQSAPQATATLPAGTTSTQPSSQPSSQVTAQTVSQPSPLPTLQPASLRALPTQTKVMTPTVVTVAAVPGGPLRSVVAAVPPGSAPPPTALPPASVSASAPSCKTASAYAQTLTTVAARPVAVAAQPARPGQAQPSVYIQTAHRASPGPTTERTGTYPLPGTTYYYEAPGGYQVAGVAGRSYTGTTPYIVQTTPARAVGTTTQQVQGLVASSVPTCVANAVANTIVSTASGGAASTIAGSVVAGVTGSVVSAVPGSVVSGVAGGVVTSVVSSMASGQPVRFNSVMVVDPTRTALAAYVPAEGGAGTAFIAADSSLLAAQNAPQALPVSASASVQASPQATSQPTPIITQTTPVPSNQTLQQETTQPSLQISGTAVGTQFTPTSTQAPVQIQMIPTPTPIHIQMHPQTHSAVIPLAQTTASQQAQPVVLTSTQTMGVTQTQPTIQFQTQTQAQSQNQASGQTQTQQPLSATKPNASPRPSILRKRDNEGSPMKAQKNLTPMLVSMGTAPTIVIPSPSLTAPSSPPSPPKRPDSGGPQSSGSTTISATSSPGQESPPPAPQPPPSAASITAGLHAAGLHPGPPSTEMSPRKKPRKQQLTGNELQEHKISDDEMEFLTEDKEEDFHQQQQQGQQPPQQQPQQQQPHNQQPNIQQHPQGMQQQQQEQLQQSGQQQQQQQQQAQQQQTPTAPSEFYKRPNVSLLSTYRYTWKSRHNHFLRHSDVRPKDERRPTVGELASQRHILQRINGWKVHHLTTQMEDLADVESQVCQQLETMLGVMERKAEQDQDKDVNRVNELIKGNMQRSRVIADQLLEAKATVMKIFEHKTHVAEIINRSSGKRTFKKRDKS